jgi:parallel beta-helix repeat protein
MRLLLLIFLAFINLPVYAIPGDIPLSKGMIIRSSVKIIKANYKLNGSDSLNQSVIIIEGNNITVDFNGAELRGSTDKSFPNEFYGCAMIIKAGKNVIIKNANIRGFKVALMARGVENLTIQNCNFSYNYRQKLYSNRLREDVSDWMSYHHNEKDEWLRYGAGIYLRDCNKINVHDNVITGGQCGLMLTNCNDGLIYNNNFSFNSAIGIGMYRSSRNKILHNRLDFNVRGYSHGIFNRGQDSAGILVFEQCNENDFGYNSATHGGDGFFLWAGQHTMDTGEGGCNDNRIFRNNFSYAPANGIEVTFSKNMIHQNILKECDYGIWGGYSFNTVISKNHFADNRIGIAIEHGQNNWMHKNFFNKDKEGIKLWGAKNQSTNWGYAKYRDTKSHTYEIAYNFFEHVPIPFNFSTTDSIELISNSLKNYKQNKIDSSTVTNLIYGDYAFPKPDIFNPMLPESLFSPDITTPITKHHGRKEIRITQWGPYDYHYPILWLTNIDSTGKMFFDILGPKGSWAIKDFRGVKNISVNAGSFPSSITAEKISDDILIEATYTGEGFTTQFGEKYPAKKPFTFSFKEFTPDITWDAKWYKWDLAHDPNKNYEKFKEVFTDKPVKTETPGKLDYTWWGEIGKGLPADSFATVATGILQVPKGKYDLGITADDLVKVFIDNELVIDFWDATKFVNDDDAHHNTIIELDGQKHTIRVEHVENGGYATVIFTLTRL